MNVNEIVALANAGFTAQQIAVLASQAQPIPQPVQQPIAQPIQQALQTLPVQPVVPIMQPVQAAAVQQPAAPAQQPMQQPGQIPGQVDFSALMGKLDNIGAQIQQQNIIGSQQPAVQTADDILAEIIAPKPPVKDK